MAAMTTDESTTHEQHGNEQRGNEQHARDVPAGTGPEREMLEGWLDFHRATLVEKCAGLDDARLREASAPPSDLTLLGLLRHMTDVERHWFRRVIAAEDLAPLYFTAEAPDDDFVVGEGDTRAATLGVWHEEVAVARSVAEGRSLEETGLHPRLGTSHSLRWVYLHMIEEYARHNGHADLLRERIDGVTGV